MVGQGEILPVTGAAELEFDSVSLPPDKSKRMMKANNPSKPTSRLKQLKTWNKPFGQ